jgi:hypothetical protein
MNQQLNQHSNVNATNARLSLQRIAGGIALISALISALFLVGCGGGGGGTGVTDGGKITATAQASQKRSLKGFDVVVTPYVFAGSANNQPSTIDIEVTNPALIDQVTTFNGKDYESADTVVVPSSLIAPGKWRVEWPQNKTESALLMRFTMKNGDVIETGVDDFRFKAPAPI